MMQFDRLDPEIIAILPLLQERLAPPYTVEKLRAAIDMGPRQSADGFAAKEDALGYTDQRIGRVDTRIYCGGTSPCPTIIYMHGGGWVGGNLTSHEFIPRRIARQTRGVVVSLDYPRSPEAHFPDALHACVAVISEIANNVSAYGGRRDLIAVAGDSAGGNLAAAAALQALEGGLPIAAQLLIYPILDIAGHYTSAEINNCYPSRLINAEGPLLRTSLMALFARLYCPSEGDAESVFASPARVTDFARSPPTVVAVAECDPLRDEAMTFAARLRANGVETRLHVGAGLIHGYFGIAPVCRAAESEADAVVDSFADMLPRAEHTV